MVKLWINVVMTAWLPTKKLKRSEPQCSLFNASMWKNMVWPLFTLYKPNSGRTHLKIKLYHVLHISTKSNPDLWPGQPMGTVSWAAHVLAHPSQAGGRNLQTFGQRVRYLSLLGFWLLWLVHYAGCLTGLAVSPLTWHFRTHFIMLSVLVWLRAHQTWHFRTHFVWET